MEEKKSTKNDAKASKLTYEQLEAYASQISEQAKRVFQENQMLRKALYENNLKEVEIALKCLDHADMFSPDFVKAVTERIEEVMTPQKEDIEKPDNSEVKEDK